MFVELALTLSVVLIAIVLYKLSNNAKYFENRNLKYRGILPFLKNLICVWLSKTDRLTDLKNMYDVIPDVPIYGQFDFNSRQYIIRDPEAFKRMAIKDFDHFEDHPIIVDENVDDLFGNSLLLMRGEKWRQMRATLSPAFTGSKMRQMFELVSECGDEIVKHLQKRAENGEKIDVEVKDLFSRYTNDVIATCAFGVKVNSVENPENEFYMSGKQITNFGGGILTSTKNLIVFFLPKIAKFFKMKFFDESNTKFFKDMIIETMNTRQINEIYRPDMINILMQVRQGNLNQQQPDETTTASKETDGFATVEESQIGKSMVTRKWTDHEIIAQCFIFFFAGFEISSTQLAFTAYELVANPDIQQKLYEEIAEVNEQIGGKRITYDTLQKMKYLDQVVSESLRKWPSNGDNDRLCVKDYTYEDGDTLKFTIEKGSTIIFPIYGMHKDPKYFPNPEKFDPERFNDENKHKIVAGSYLPFGIGPRNCIGSRFALMEIKAILYYLLLNFSFEVNKDTQIPLKLKKAAGVAIEKGVHLELKPRSH